MNRKCAEQACHQQGDDTDGKDAWLPRQVQGARPYVDGGIKGHAEKKGETKSRGSLQFDKMLEECLTVKSKTKLPAYKYILAMIYLIYMGYKRLAHFMYLHDDDFFKRILGIATLPVQSTFWRFLNRRLHKHNERQLQMVNFKARELIWKLANVKLKEIHIDVDPTTETVYGKHDGARKGYNPRERGKKGFRPIAASISETNELIACKFRIGKTVSGEEFADFLACFKVMGG